MPVTSDPVPPVPQHTPPVDEGNPRKLFPVNWMQWFLALREKINILNESIVNLSDLEGIGFLAKNGAQWVLRTLTGTAGKISVTNGDGTAGNPVFNLVPTAVTPGTYGDPITIAQFTVDGDGRLTDADEVPVEAVLSIVAGDNITVDDTDPRNPIVSAVDSAGNTATYLTAADETATLPNSRELLAGTNITFDDVVPGERTINAAGGGGGGTVTSVDVSGGTTGLTFSGGPVTISGTITMAGTLDLDNGGTGATAATGARTNLGAVGLTGAETIADIKTFSSPIYANDGTVAAPGITFAGDTGHNAGFYLSAQNEVSYGANGTQRFTMGPGGINILSGDILVAGVSRESTQFTIDVHDADYTLVLTDAGKVIHRSVGAGAFTWTIPPNSSVAFPIGIRVRFADTLASTTVNIAPGVGVTLRAGGAAGTRTLAAGGFAEAVKVATDTWLMHGSGIT